MMCEKCKNISQKLKLDTDSYQETTISMWFDLEHDDLLAYADYNNGVSEGGTGYVCRNCFTFFDLLQDMSMEENEIGVELLDEIDEDTIKEAALVMVLEEKAKEIKENIQKQDIYQAFVKTDVYVPHTFHFETGEKQSFLPLEIAQKFGWNHETFYVSSPIFLSLHELIGQMGTNDEYVKKSFLLSFEIKSSELDVRVQNSPYTKAEIKISTDSEIKPNEIYLINVETEAKTLLSEVSLEECLNRNHDEFLNTIRTMQTDLSKTHSVENIDDKIKEKMKIIEEKQKG